MTRNLSISRSASRSLTCLLLAISFFVGASAPWVPSWVRAGAGPVRAFAASPLEDCDLDGYDDHTGAPVPWAGFDSTRGDTIPSGWDGVANSWTGQHTNDGSSAGTSGGGSSGTKKPVTGGSSTGNGTTGSGSSSTAAGNQPTSGVQTPGTVVTTVAVAAPAAPGAEAVSRADTITVTSARGTLQVFDADGALIHAGGALRITGDGFYPGVSGFVVWIDSIQARLTTVSTDPSGRFELVVDLPDGIRPGAHRIGITYGGSHLAHAPMTVGPPAADSFLEALLVGFDERNTERDAGLSTLLGLSFVGAVGYGWRSVVRRPASRRPLRTR